MCSGLRFHTVGGCAERRRALTLSGDTRVQRSRVISLARTAAVWIPTILLILIFAPQLPNKLSDTGGWAPAFRNWGYPVWFRITIGIVEALAAAMLLWHRTAIAGAALIIAVMLGGTATHIIKDGGRHVTSEVVPIVLATTVLVLRLQAARRKRTARLPR